ncbi:Tetraspanin family-domain-containing protein [Dichotomocladium elegans]|nr:Tetraspanin family-domain-containing protein [Dichotomocladium elegans]
MAFGVLGAEQRLEISVLLPINILKMISILGIIICFTAVIGLIGAFFRDRRALYILYTVIVLIALTYQMTTAVIVYDQAAHTSSWMSQTWAEASFDYRAYAQNKFKCCGFSHGHDHPIPSPICKLDDVISSAPPCYEPLTQFIQHRLKVLYIVLFSAISVELLGLCNAITMLCARYTHGNDRMSGTSKRWRFLNVNKRVVVQPAEQLGLGPMASKTQRMDSAIDNIETGLTHSTAPQGGRQYNRQY